MSIGKSKFTICLQKEKNFTVNIWSRGVDFCRKIRWVLIFISGYDKMY